MREMLSDCCFHEKKIEHGYLGGSQIGYALLSVYVLADDDAISRLFS
jgi:hypothetical protein